MTNKVNATKNLNPVALVAVNDDGKTKVHWYENSILEGLEPGQSVELVVGIVGAPRSMLGLHIPSPATFLSENVNGKFRVIEEDQKVDNPVMWSPPFPVYRSPEPGSDAFDVALQAAFNRGLKAGNEQSVAQQELILELQTKLHSATIDANRYRHLRAKARQVTGMPGKLEWHFRSAIRGDSDLVLDESVDESIKRSEQ